MKISPSVRRVFFRLGLALALAVPAARAQETSGIRSANGTAYDIVPTGPLTTVITPSDLPNPIRYDNPTQWAAIGDGIGRVDLYRAYLPALPPVWGVKPPDEPPLPPYYPAAIADFAGETFYLPYYILSQNPALSTKRTQRIATYRATREHLVSAMQTRLTELRTAEPAQRQAALTELAAAQAEPLQALALEEEAIRQDLTTPKLFKDYANEPAIHVWEVTGPPTELRKLDDEVQTTIKAAQFQDGLSLNQRLLLQEISIELQLPAAPAGSVVFLGPAAARLRLPDDLPPVLVGLLTEYQQLKTGLKAELREAIVRHQQFLVTSQRTQAYEKLAREEDGKFAQLDTLTEKIRATLAALLPEPAESDPLLADALLAPGLSSAQRRLLFNAVLVQREKARPAANLAAAGRDKVEYLAVATQTDLGKKFPRPSPEKPAYYVATDAGFTEGGARLAGEKPPSPVVIGLVLRTALHSRGYEPATTTRPPSLLLVYHWGFLGSAPLGANSPLYHARLNLVAPPDLAGQMVDFTVHEPIGPWTPRQRDAISNASDDRYFVIVSAYDYADFTRGQQSLLWRVRLSTPAARSSLKEALPTLVTGGAPFFGENLENSRNAEAAVSVPNLTVETDARSRFAVPEQLSAQIDLNLLRAIVDREHYEFTGERPAKRPLPAVTQTTSLPHALVERIAAYQKEKLALQESLAERVKAPAPGAPTREAVEAFERENRVRIAALNETREAIRSELARLAAERKPAGASGNQLLDALAREFAADAAAATQPH